MSNNFISIVTACYNEVGNVDELYKRIKSTLAGSNYDYEHIFIDNASTDGTQDKLRALAVKDNRVKVIFNARNFGHIRSPYHGLLQGEGSAVIAMASDLQDPPEMILKFIQEWEKGYKIVIGVKEARRGSGWINIFRHIYYRLLTKLSDVELIEHFTGFGLYDKEVIQILRRLNDPYPYFRGIIADIGYPIAKIKFDQGNRVHGASKNNFYTLYDLAMLGITGYTKIPLRIATMAGFVSSLVSFCIGVAYLLYKLLYWYQFQLGSAPLVIGLFFLGSIQLFFLGIVGEYIGSIYTQVMKRPLVIERERLNF